MATRRVLYENRQAQAFRAVIRPSLVGQLRSIEPRISARAAEELELFLRQVIVEAVAASRMHDDKGVLLSQLLAGRRVFGKASLAALRGVIYAYPWVFPHEYGATIHPAPGKRYLALPVYFALRSDGTPKFRNPGSWRRFGSFVYTARSGNKFLAYKSKSGELRLLYLLVEEVRIPARLRLNVRAETLSGALMSAWGLIYVEEATASGIINLWGETS